MRPRVAALAACAVASLLATEARADDAAAAARHFDAGTTLYKASLFRQAKVEFQQAWDARHSFDVAANLGDCELEIGQFRDAAEHLAYAIRELPVSVKPSVRERLQARFALARAEVATVRVHVTPAQAAVVVGGHTYAPPVPDEIFVEPGAATVEARLAGYAPGTATTQPLAKGTAGEVSLALVALPGADAGSKSVPLILVGAGVTAAGLVTGLAFTLIGGSKASTADTTLAHIQASHPGDTSPCSAVPPDTRCKSLKDMNGSADTMHDVGTVAFIATGVVAAATLTYILWPTSKSAEPTTGFRIMPALGPTFGGAAFKASF